MLQLRKLWKLYQSYISFKSMLLEFKTNFKCVIRILFKNNSLQHLTFYPDLAMFKLTNTMIRNSFDPLWLGLFRHLSTCHFYHYWQISQNMLMNPHGRHMEIDFIPLNKRKRGFLRHKMKWFSWCKCRSSFSSNSQSTSSNIFSCVCFT